MSTPSNAQPMSPALEIHYRFTQPDPWGDHFWSLLNQDDKSWNKAVNLQELNEKIRTAKPKELYLRIIVTLKPENLNNLYFSAKHSGSLEIFVNGSKSAGSDMPAASMQDYVISPRRPENIGTNCYGIHFIDSTSSAPFVEIAIKNSDWINTDGEKVKPAPVLSDLIRDAEVCKGADGAYYMTGTTGPDHFLMPNPLYWQTNQGIQVFRSEDLKEWKSLGYVWTFEKNGTWNKEYGAFGGRGPARGIFAPEIKYHDKKYWINYSVNNMTKSRFFGIGLLASDSPSGPYHEMSPDKPLSEGFDSNIFIDDNGTAYLLKHGGEIARLKKDFSAVEEPFRHLAPSDYPWVGYEGVYLFKYNKKYYLTAADWNIHEDGKISYDSMIASSDSIFGPYGKRYCAIRYGGHNGYFQGPGGNIFATVWCYPDGDYHWQRVSIVQMQLNADGRFEIKNSR